MRFYLILAMGFVSMDLFAQAVVGGVQSKGMDMNLQPLGYVKEVRSDTKEVEGNVYLYEQWFMGKIEFVNGSTLIERFIRYNIQSNFIEIKLETKKVGGSEGRNIRSFEILNEVTQENEKYINATDFKINKTKLTGFLRELKLGEFSLYSKTDVKLVTGNYVAALDMGEEDDTLSKKTVYYVMKNKELTEVIPNKKRFAASFPELEGEILTCIKDLNLSLKDEDDLLTLIKLLNSRKV